MCEDVNNKTYYFILYTSFQNTTVTKVIKINIYFHATSYHMNYSLSLPQLKGPVFCVPQQLATLLVRIL